MKTVMDIPSDDVHVLNFQWFLEHYDEIYRRHGECHVAIKDRAIIGVYHSSVEAYQKTCETEVPGSFSIQYCNGDESGYTAYFANPIMFD